jgi:hypothetical protein
VLGGERAEGIGIGDVDGTNEELLAFHDGR